MSENSVGEKWMMIASRLIDSALDSADVVEKIEMLECAAVAYEKAGSLCNVSHVELLIQMAREGSL